MAIHTFTFGTTPHGIIKEALDGTDYPMELVGIDAEVVRDIVNQGIDSRLEAVTGSFAWHVRRTCSGMGLATVLKCSVTPEGMSCLLRRLIEYGSEEADSLRSGILSTLDIDEV